MMDPSQLAEGQSLNDIQSYLVNFNKEISAGGQTYILATSDGTQQAVAGGTFVVAHPGDHPQLYEDGTLLEGVAGDAGITVPKTETLVDDHKLKLEGGGAGAALQAGALQTVDQALLQGEQAIFSPINITPSNAGTLPAQPAPTEPLFTVQGAGDGAEISGAGPGQLITVQPSVQQQGLVAIQGSPGGQQGLVAIQGSPGGQQGLVALQGSPGAQQVMAITPPGQTQVAHTEGEEAEEEEEEEEDEEGEGGPDGEANNYQTVTIVPSEVNQGGEVSYVLIVSQNDQEQKANADGNIDMSVYDFKEEARGAGAMEIDEDSTSAGAKKGIKTTPKKQNQQLSTQLMCNYCNYTSPKRYLLTRHMKTHSEERPHKCHICDRGFKTVASLQNHINTHTGVRPHKCKECDAAFTTSGELVRHVRYRHTYEKPHKCPECDYASVELSKLKRHMRSHTGERPYQCPHCTYASPDTYKLKRHLRIHTGEKPYECDICHTRFTQSNSLKAHKLIHTGNKPIYQCELCPTTCGRKTDLKIHVQKLHTSEKPLQCKKCGKSFPDRYTWKIHVKTHEGEKCFKCELCPYAALSQRHLESHLLTHTGEKPFECDECDQTFRQKQLLRRHKNLYHTPDYIMPAPKEKIHECTECGKAFAHKGNLLRHRAGHDPENQEYQEELTNYKLEKGDAYDEEAEELEELEEEEEEELMVGEMDTSQEQVLVTQAVIGDGQNYQGESTGQIHMANINGQQVQLQLVNLNDENNTQVYIQIDNNQQLQSLMGSQAEAGLGEQLMVQPPPTQPEEEPEGAELDQPITAMLEAETPPTGNRVRMVTHRLDVKQEEDLKQEEVLAAEEAVEEQEIPLVIGKHRLEIADPDMTPTKRQRRDSGRRLRTDEDCVSLSFEASLDVEEEEVLDMESVLLMNLLGP